MSQQPQPRHSLQPTSQQQRRQKQRQRTTSSPAHPPTHRQRLRQHTQTSTTAQHRQHTQTTLQTHSTKQPSPNIRHRKPQYTLKTSRIPTPHPHPRQTLSHQMPQPQQRRSPNSIRHNIQYQQLLRQSRPTTQANHQRQRNNRKQNRKDNTNRQKLGIHQPTTANTHKLSSPLTSALKGKHVRA